MSSDMKISGLYCCLVSEWARTVDMAASCSLGVRIYCRKAALCQRPSV